MARADGIGLTCAACHTGQIVYGDASITIDGGSAMLNLGKLRTAVGLAIIQTAVSPGRFNRFAARVWARMRLTAPRLSCASSSKPQSPV